MLKDIYYLSKKDLLLEFRKKETLFSMGLFCFASVLIFSALFSFIDLPLETKYGISTAFIWFIITFAIMLGLSSIFSREIKQNSIYSLLSLSVKPQAIFISKLVYLGVMLAIIEFLTIILAVVFLRIGTGAEFLSFILVLTIGTINLTIAGCIVAFLTLYAKSKTLAVPILFFPIILPSVLIATQTSLNIALFYDIESIIINSLILFFHSVILLVLALLMTDELLSD
ncbi:MAG: heme exporter protein CcmB [Candidatus Heimdallarchaeota archaeon]|nr:heme exporter protein CcmB [Candidatus Heimdallarchaeota archaeon]